MLQEEEEELSVRQPPAPERLKKVSKWSVERALALQVQTELVEAKQLELLSIEAGLRAAERELDFIADSQQVKGEREEGGREGRVREGRWRQGRGVGWERVWMGG
jgi:hypothetical protein